MKVYGWVTVWKFDTREKGALKVGGCWMTENGSVFVDGIVQCWVGKFKRKCSGDFDKEVLGIGWLIRAAINVGTEGPGRKKGIIGGLRWTIRDGLIWVGFKGVWGLNVLRWGCGICDGVLNGLCAGGFREEG